MKPSKPPLSNEKSPDDVCRLAVRACLSARKGKSVREIATKCDLGNNTTRRHLRNLIKMRYAKQVGRGTGTKYLSRSVLEGRGRLGTPSTNPDQITPGKKATPLADRKIEGTNLTHGQADQMIEVIREWTLKNYRRWRRGRGLTPR